MIPKAFIDSLVERSNIVEIVGRHVELKKGGASFKGLCPFHAEKKPSFTVTPARNTYHCFGCGAHGDALKFIQEHLGLQFVEAVKDLAQIVGMQVPEEEQTARHTGRGEAVEKNVAATSVRDILRQAEEHYASALRSSQEAIEFLKGRGVLGATAARYRLGFARASERGLASVFARYDDQGLVDAGLVRVDGARRVDRFCNQVMFPVRNVNGADIGFVGMGISNDRVEEDPTIAETALFQPTRDLYGVFEARESIRKSGYAVVVVGGCLDVMAVAQCGVTNVVGPVTGELRADQLKQLLRLTTRVMFVTSEGSQDELREMTAGIAPSADFKAALLPGGISAGGYARAHGVNAMRECLGHAVN